jgi:SAM-dependent methyltransferase
LSEEQIAVARETTRFPNVEYQVVSFEDFQALPQSFDLIISAQAFHWIPPEIGYPKVHELLKLGGVLAVFWNLTYYADSSRPWLQQLNALYKERCPDRDKKFAKEVDEEIKSGNFSIIEQRNFRHEILYTKEQYKGLIQTMSWMICLPETTQHDILKEMDKILASESEPLSISYSTKCFLGKK